MHIVNLLKDQRRPATGRFALYPGRTGLLQTVEHLAADFKANMLPGVKPDPLAQPDHPGPQDKISTSTIKAAEALLGEYSP
jgi:hypothetical protein